jgi:hypothetical protein
MTTLSIATLVHDRYTDQFIRELIMMQRGLSSRGALLRLSRAAGHRHRRRSRSGVLRDDVVKERPAE